jgi:hypothetical protein
VRRNKRETLAAGEATHRLQRGEANDLHFIEKEAPQVSMRIIRHSCHWFATLLQRLSYVELLKQWDHC